MLVDAAPRDLQHLVVTAALGQGLILVHTPRCNRIRLCAPHCLGCPCWIGATVTLILLPCALIFIVVCIGTRRLRCPSMYHVLQETVEELKSSDLAWFDCNDKVHVLPTLSPRIACMSSPPHRSPRSSTFTASSLCGETISMRSLAAASHGPAHSPRTSDWTANGGNSTPSSATSSPAVPLVPPRSSRGGNAYMTGEICSPRALAAAHLAAVTPRGGGGSSSCSGSGNVSSLGIRTAHTSSLRPESLQSPRALAAAHLANEENKSKV